MNQICHIEVLKDRRDFTARAYLADGLINEYCLPIFQEVLTEMALGLQDIFEEKI